MENVNNTELFPSPDVFLLESSLYRWFECSENIIFKFEKFGGPVRAFCIDCNEMGVFKNDLALAGNRPNPTPMPFNANPKSDSQTIMSPDQIKTFQEAQELKFKKQNRIFIITLSCVINSDHKLFFCFNLKNGKIAKIGQFPSIADLASKDLKKYRKILGNQYGEFSRAIGLFANGIGIGSFTYLRRIFENLIEQAHQKSLKSQNWDELKYKTVRWDDRIELLKDELPIFLVQNKKLYSILSLGIHELDEETCKKFFPLMQSSIELILDEKIAIAEKKAKIEAATKGLQNFKIT